MADNQEAAAAPGSTLAERQRQQNERLRDAARHLVVAFGAVAATLLVGLGLTRLDNLSEEQQTLALIFAAIAVLGVITLLVISVWLSAAGTITADQLVKSGAKLSAKHAAAVVAAKSNGLLGGYESLGGSDPQNDLLAAREAAWERFSSAFADYADGGDAKTLRRRAQHVQQLDKVVATVMAVASHARLRYRFVRASIAMGAAATVTAAGVLLFVWITNPAQTPELVVLPPAPTAASLDIVTAIRPQVEARLGDGCEAELDALPVIILGTTEDAVDVITDAGDTCAQLRLEVTEGLGTLVPR